MILVTGSWALVNQLAGKEKTASVKEEQACNYNQEDELQTYQLPNGLIFSGVIR